MSLRILDYNYVFDSKVGLTASSADSEFPVTNLRDFHRDRVWRSTSGTSANVVIDLRTTDAIDTFAILFDPMTDVTISDSATVTLQANPTNSWGSPALSTVLSVDNEYPAISHFYTSDQSYRYWRLLLSDATSGASYFEISKIFLGKATQLSQMPEIGFSDRAVDLSRASVTSYGQEYADVYPTRRYLDLDYRLITEADKQTLKDLYLRLGQVTPLLVALDPTETIFENANEQLIYGFLDNDFKAAQAFTTYFDFSLAIREAM
jgi:hypothetical protein